LQRQNEEDLCRIYSKVMSRPFLFENGSVPTKQNQQIENGLKKKGKRHQQSNHQTSKHIHQSPLKVVDAEGYDETTEKKKRLSPQGFELYS
jgi:ribosomal protein S19E (S16A)